MGDSLGSVFVLLPKCWQIIARHFRRCEHDSARRPELRWAGWQAGMRARMNYSGRLFNVRLIE